GLWVASAMGLGDRQRAEQAPDGRTEVVVDDAKYRLRLLTFDERTYEHAYNAVSNRLLWFLHHYLWDLPRSPALDRGTAEAWEDYGAYNRAFAEALAGEAGDGPTDILVQDYHLSLVPAELRALAPRARVAHFHHCPFAGPTYLRLLPESMWRRLLEGLLGADLLGFQTERWAANFLASCALLEDADIDVEGRRIGWRGRTIRVGVYPISIDAEALRSRAASPRVRGRRRALDRWRGDRKLMLRVDRAELSKNLLRGFQAFGDLLERYPEWRRRVVFLALVNPSRPGVPEYRAYTEECLALAERINAEFREPGWRPIELRVDDDYDEVLAAYGLYDVLVVNPIFDGMNLVAKEGALLNRHDGVLVLSRNAGAFTQLGAHAVGVDPLDLAGTADAMAAALSMPTEERGQRARALRRAAAAVTPAEWAGRQIQDLERDASAAAT
ncbi:MAG TPA: trehalose-6-phosphate synthase, partial [Actinomycetota bacterium]|nr:trehalose-6-phosphate synthase [Actinomycetota bacterium]